MLKIQGMQYMPQEKNIYLEQAHLLSIMANINYGNKQILKHSGYISWKFSRHFLNVTKGKKN